MNHSHFELALLDLKGIELSLQRAEFRFDRRRWYNNDRMRVRVYDRMTTLNMFVGWRRWEGCGGAWDARPRITQRQKQTMERLLESVGFG